jgi:formate hydrogenlyase subunit 6/NADH:ubiquinone oxidoreductase subunit I
MITRPGLHGSLRSVTCHVGCLASVVVETVPDQYVYLPIWRVAPCDACALCVNSCQFVAGTITNHPENHQQRGQIYM